MLQHCNPRPVTVARVDAPNVKSSFSLTVLLVNKNSLVL